jgi:hypothetical protein
MCGLHRAQGDEEHVFLGLASKSRSTVSPSLPLKLVALSFSIWALKLAIAILCFCPQNHRDDFLLWISQPSGLQFI